MTHLLQIKNLLQSKISEIKSKDDRKSFIFPENTFSIRSVFAGLYHLEKKRHFNAIFY